MLNEIQPLTEPGRRMVAMAEAFAERFAPRAAENDLTATYPLDHLDELKAAGYLYAPLPEDAGGMGVESVHDILLASSRLARGDAGLTLGVNMHQIIMMTYARNYRMAVASGEEAKAQGIFRAMKRAVETGMLIGAAVSEPDQDLLRPSTTVHFDGGNWLISGRKIFSSGAPGMTHFSVSLAHVDADGNEVMAYAVVPKNAPGVTVNDDWDAMGMRDSGSCSLVFDNVPVPREPANGSLAGIITSAYLEQYLTSGASHAAAATGIAESAHQLAVKAFQGKMQRTGERAYRPTLQHLAAENVIDLAALRGVLHRSLKMVDEFYERNPAAHGTLDEANAVFAEVQAAKAFINQATQRIVDRSMTIAGGGAFMSSHPLSRHYRDARATAFMHPLAANISYEYLGTWGLGMEPTRL